MKRRKICFRNFEQVIEDVELLHRNGYTQAGNWSLGQMCNHMAIGIDMTANSSMPRVLQRISVFCFLRLVFLGKIGNALGMRVPSSVPQSEPIDDAAGLKLLKAGIDRLKHDEDAKPTAPFHLWHFQHHLSFLIPQNTDGK